MTKQPSKSKYKWMSVGLYGFWVLLGLYAVILIAQYGASAGIGPADAATGDGAGSKFTALVCALYSQASYLIGALAVLMIVAAGIVYATSQGQSGGEASGIGMAKSMIIAALSGVALYLFGYLLLGTCGAGAGGVLSDIVNFFQF